jgi:hypothetical protein
MIEIEVVSASKCFSENIQDKELSAFSFRLMEGVKPNFTHYLRQKYGTGIDVENDGGMD